MTVYGVDVSQYQAGLPAAAVKANGYAFIIARALSFPAGQMVVDPAYPAFRAGAKTNGLLFGAYVLFHPSRTPAEQASLLAQVIGDPSIPVMCDWEPDGANPSIGYAEACFDACAARGLRVTALYGPRWYENLQGNPLLTGRPWVLVSSSYGADPAGYGSAVYPGDSSPGWTGYGGLTPTLLQFGSQIRLTGYPGPVDADAYRGTLAQLKQANILKDFAAPIPPPPAPEPTAKGAAMLLIVQPDANQVPPGKPWPGVFLWTGVPGAGNLTHIPDETDQAHWQAAGVPVVPPVSWAQWQRITAGAAPAE